MNSFRILLVEDDPDDVELLSEAFRDNRIPVKIENIMEGNQVMPYLEICNIFPNLIILDLNLPKVDGKELLRQIKSSRFKTVPVVILTTSSAKEDIEFCMRHGADKYLTKPSTIDGLNATVEKLVAVISENALD